jgi:hypothetical protein
MKVQVNVNLDDLDYEQVDALVLARLKECYIDNGREIDNYRTGSEWVHVDDYHSAMKRIPMLMELIKYFSIPDQADKFFEMHPIDCDEDWFDDADDQQRIEDLEASVYQLDERVRSLERENSLQFR